MALALPAIGAFVASWVGVTGLSAFTAGIIGGALVGAAVGGLTAAFTGGNIGKGLLFGGIGGAVLGGISGMFAAGSFSTQSAGIVGSAGEGTVGALGGEGSVWATSQAFTPAKGAASLAPTLGGGGGGGLSAGEGFLYSGLAQGALQLGGSMIAGAGAQDQAEWAAQNAAAEAEKERQLRLKIAEMQAAVAEAGIPEDHWSGDDARLREHFNRELTQRDKEFVASMGIRREELQKPYDERERMRKISGESLEGIKFEEGTQKPTAPGVYQQVVENNEILRA